MIQFFKQGRFLTMMFMLLCCLSLYAADDDLITEQITIKLDEAGTLPDKIVSSKKYKITNLKIVGEINGTDLRLIREMAGKDYDGHDTPGKLSELDLSEAKIVSGGGNYYYNKGYTSNDEIGKYAFYGCSVLTRLSIPSGVTWIDEYAFSGCSGLTSVSIPSSVTWIRHYAFSGCRNLTSVSIPSGVTWIASGVFSGCSGLTSLNIPSSVTSIGEYAFYKCSGLTSLSIPSGVTSIGKSTFEGCSGLTSLSIPSGVTRIDEYTFYGCSGLTSLSIPSGVTSIGKSTFKGCSGLTSLSIPSGVTRIDEYTFYGCSGLTSLSIPSSVTRIDKCAFSYCRGLTSLNIPSSLRHLGEYSFSGCSGLTSIYVNWDTSYAKRTTFDGVDKQKCTVYVPKGTYWVYKLSQAWSDFENIVEYDPTGIDKVTTFTNAKEVSRYSVNGQRLSAPTKGLNIVKYSDGSVKKESVQ